MKMYANEFYSFAGFKPRCLQRSAGTSLEADACCGSFITYVGGSKVKKTILFLDLPYHFRTKSSLFLIDFLREYYSIETYYYVPRLEIIKDMRNILDREFDFLICWQVMPESFVLEQINYKKGIFFPMYDNAVITPEENWERFRKFTIINFSYVLHEYLIKKGICSKYIQYFPRPRNIVNWGKKDSLFFWQRVNKIDINLIIKLCANLNLSSIHLHNALDPGYVFSDINSKSLFEIEYSGWLERKEDIWDLIMQSSYYAAPREYEGIGMSFLEAMALGRCIIAPNRATMNEYIVDKETGLLYDYENPVPLLFADVRKIQKRTYEYMSEGYLAWEKNKFDILDWIEEDQASQSDYQLNKETVIENDEVKKLKAYFGLMNKWLKLKNKAISIIKYFRDFNIQTIMIYGGGAVADRLSEELEGTDIKVVGILDRNPKYRNDQVPVFCLKDNYPKCDAIVVTPVYSFGIIYIQLIKKRNDKVVSMDEIIDYLMEHDNILNEKGKG